MEELRNKMISEVMSFKLCRLQYQEIDTQSELMSFGEKLDEMNILLDQVIKNGMAKGSFSDKPVSSETELQLMIFFEQASKAKL
jgi:hypothetical protein